MTAQPWRPDENLARMHARADAAGFQLVKLASGVYRVIRWGRTLDLPSIKAVEQFLQMVRPA